MGYAFRSFIPILVYPRRFPSVKDNIYYRNNFVYSSHIYLQNRKNVWRSNLPRRKKKHSGNKKRKPAADKKRSIRWEDDPGSRYEESQGGPVLTEMNYNDERSDAVHCPYCNAELYGLHRFCTNCGRPIETEQEAKRCHSCGTEISENTRFCTECGAHTERENEMIECRICGTRLSKKELFCTLCGTTTDNTRRCSVCGTELFENIRFCTVCGTSSNGGERECPACYGRISASDAFCTSCGHRAVKGTYGLELEEECERERMKKYYAVLEIEPDATRRDIKKAYKKKMLEYHPDKVHSLGKKWREFAEEESKKINEAYHALMEEID